MVAPGQNTIQRVLAARQHIARHGEGMLALRQVTKIDGSQVGVIGKESDTIAVGGVDIQCHLKVHLDHAPVTRRTGAGEHGTQELNVVGHTVRISGDGRAKRDQWRGKSSPLTGRPILDRLVGAGDPASQGEA